MIVDPVKDQMMTNALADSPPAYDYASEARTDNAAYQDKNKFQAAGGKPPSDPAQSLMPYSIAGPSYTTQPLHNPSPTVYQYMNPRTGQNVASLLPPDHPEMVCLQAGMHVPETKYGLLGVLAAIFWFPLGIGLCLLDRRVRCTRCGLMIESGMCGP